MERKTHHNQENPRCKAQNGRTRLQSYIHVEFMQFENDAEAMPDNTQGDAKQQSETTGNNRRNSNRKS